MNRRKKRTNPLRIIVLLLLVGGALYVNQVVVPATPPLFLPTPTPTRSPESFLNEARSAIKDGKFEKAQSAFEEAIKANPKDINIYIELSRWQVLYNQYDKAKENAENALLIDPHNSLAHAVKGWVLGRQGSYLEAQGELTNAIEIDPGNPLAYAYEAEILALQQSENKGDLTTVDKAIEASRKAQSLGPDLMETHRARGLVLEITSNYADAIKEFEAATQLNDNLADLHLALGRNYKATDQYDKAVEQFNRAIALTPDDPDPYVETALTYLKVGEFAKGIQYATQAVQKNPSDPLLQGYLGTLMFKSGAYNDALAPLRLATRGGLTDQGVQVKGMPLDDTTMSIYARYGLSLAHTNSCGEALQISQALAQAFPDDETNMYNAEEIVNVCKTAAGQPTTTPAGPVEATSTPKP
jgi:tetratricopeptide (TPR) repeat protein